MSTELIEKVDSILKKADIPDRHTFFQIEKFIVGKEPTAQGQLWQITRELQARRETIDAYKHDLKDAEDNLELFDIKIERFDREIRQLAQESTNQDADLNIKENEINIRKLQREKEALIKSSRKVNKKMKCVMEEMEFLSAGHKQIEDAIGESKPLDDENAQKEYWNERLLEEFNLRIILKRPLDPDFVKTVMALHDEAIVKKHLTSALEGIQQQMIEQRQALPVDKRPKAEIKAHTQG
jgi:chromosome segregation ATPase